MYWLQLFDWYAASISVILICLVETIIVGWIYGIHNFVRDIEFMIGNPVGYCWIMCWKYITPTILTVRHKSVMDLCFSMRDLIQSSLSFYVRAVRFDHHHMFQYGNNIQ